MKDRCMFRYLPSMINYVKVQLLRYVFIVKVIVRRKTWRILRDTLLNRLIISQHVSMFKSSD